VKPQEKGNASLGYRLGAAAAAGYGLGLFAAGSLGWQHAALPVLVWACLTRREGPRAFVREWWPLILFWLGYDSMRAWGSLLYPRVAVEEPYRWEAGLFLSPTGEIWPFFFVSWMQEHATSAAARALYACCNLVYLSHLFALPALLLILWLRRRRLLFRRLLLSLAALGYLGLAGYVAYPAAPPWWVYENGFRRPTPEHSKPAGLESGSVLSTLFHYSPNRFAAIPSLHGAFPLLLLLVLALHGARWRWIVLAGFYTAAMWFACVFLNQHYIVDLLAGVPLVPAALPFAAMRRFVRRPSGQPPGSQLASLANFRVRGAKGSRNKGKGPLSASDRFWLSGFE